MLKNEIFGDECSINLKVIKDKYFRKNSTIHKGKINEFKIKDKLNEQITNNKRLIYSKDNHGDTKGQKQSEEIINKGKTNKISSNHPFSKKNLLLIEKIKLENETISLISSYKNPKIIKRFFFIEAIIKSLTFFINVIIYFSIIYLYQIFPLISIQSDYINKDNVIYTRILSSNYVQKTKDILIYNQHIFTMRILLYC